MAAPKSSSRAVLLAPLAPPAPPVPNQLPAKLPTDVAADVLALLPEDVLAALPDNVLALLWRMATINASLTAEVARIKEPLAEDYHPLKRAAGLSGVPRTTLSPRWVSKGLVKHYYDEHGDLWIDVIDARRQRFLLASQPVSRNGR
jgi:hypothetical protein